MSEGIDHKSKCLPPLHLSWNISSQFFKVWLFIVVKLLLKTGSYKLRNGGRDDDCGFSISTWCPHLAQMEKPASTMILPPAKWIDFSSLTALLTIKFFLIQRHNQVYSLVYSFPCFFSLPLCWLSKLNLSHVHPSSNWRQLPTSYFSFLSKLWLLWHNFLHCNSPSLEIFPLLLSFINVKHMCVSASHCEVWLAEILMWLVHDLGFLTFQVLFAIQYLTSLTRCILQLNLPDVE